MKIPPLFFLAVVIGFVGMGNSGCDPQSDNLEVSPRVPEPTNQVERAAMRFIVTSCGRFKAGYGNADREIFIMKDTKTGKEYLGVTDCSLIQRVEQENSN